MPSRLGDGTLGGGLLGEQPSRIAVTQEFPPDRLAVTLTDPATGQRIARWAEDEADTSNVLSAIQKSGVMPGGHKEMSGTLARDPRTDWPDLRPYTGVVLSQAGGEKVWEGRLDKAPEVDGERMAVQPAAVGYSRALEDRKGIVLGFIDSDLSKWGEPSTQRKADMLKPENVVFAASVSIGSQATGSALPAVMMDFSNVSTAPSKGMLGYAVYYSGGPSIGEVRYQFATLVGPEGNEAWLDQIQTAVDDTFESGYVHGTDHNATDATSSVTASAGSKYAALVSQFTTSEEANMVDLHSWLPKVIGDQGLALQGTWPEIGFTAKQMLEYAIPALSDLEVADESTESEGFIVPQAWFGEPTELATIVKELTKYELLDWFVLSGKLFELRKPGTYGRKWQASVGPSELQEAGIDGSRLWRTIVVRWQDVDGTTKTAGPPGSGANVESANLEITDPNHPAVRADLTREDVLDLQGVSEEKFALQVGERWLTEANEVSHSGQATLRGYILDDKGVFRPVAQIMPGDLVRFPDAGSGGTGYRKIVEVNYDHDSRTTTVTLDAPSEKIGALLERYRAKLASAGLR